MSVKLIKLPSPEEIAAWVDPLAFDLSSWNITHKRRRSAMEIGHTVSEKLEKLRESK